ncbi:radical SAM protein [Candidatus Kuenenia sp.]|uniref:radical SAM protein n=1 Tax=Candidatus Kuenenia sp. TaxID=2499824 RepID=UPI00321FA4A6
MSEFWNKISFGIDVLKAKMSGQYKPFQVQLSVTNRCNLKCSYCYANYPERTHKELTTDNLFYIIDELKKIGTKRINLVGGEPLLRKDIGKIIDHIKAKGIECVMTSNGYMVSKKINDVKKLDLLCISLDGNREANDANRGKGSYDMAIGAIKLAKENHIPFQVATVITKNNLNSIEYVLEKGKELGFSVGFSTLISQTVHGKKSVPQDMPTDDEYKQILKRLIELKEKGYPVLFSKKSLEYALNWRLGYQKEKFMGEKPDFKYIKCNAGKFFCIIDVNGDVYPCPTLVDVIKPLNCLEHGIKKAFKYVNNHPCYTCHIPCQNEFNLMYSFNLSVLFNIAKNYKSGMR